MDDEQEVKMQTFECQSVANNIFVRSSSKRRTEANYVKNELT